MAAAKEQINVSQLFLDVSKHFKSGNFQEAQKVASKSMYPYYHALFFLTDRMIFNFQLQLVGNSHLNELNLFKTLNQAYSLPHIRLSLESIESIEFSKVFLD